jgi:hypothetical protein
VADAVIANDVEKPLGKTKKHRNAAFRAQCIFLKSSVPKMQRFKVANLPNELLVYCLLPPSQQINRFSFFFSHKHQNPGTVILTPTKRILPKKMTVLLSPRQRIRQISSKKFKKFSVLVVRYLVVSTRVHV